MSDCEGCPSKGNCSSEGGCSGIQIEYNPKNNVKNVIAVMSGKGGVGKSTVAVLLAKELKKRGYQVGLLDADITGPSIPRLVGTVEQRAEMIDEEIQPVETADGIKTISLNYFVPEETQPVIWRGPMISGAVKQFWTDVVWGEIDYLVVDLPPGTGDVTLTVMQQMPVTGVLMVALPQSMVSMIVMKAVNMMAAMRKPVFGVVETMSYLQCSKCGEKHPLFDGKNGTALFEEMGVPIIAEYPMVPDLMEEFCNSDSEVYKQTKQLTDTVIEKAAAAKEASEANACAGGSCSGNCAGCHE